MELIDTSAGWISCTPKDITDGISGIYIGTYEWELKYVSHPMPSPYVDSSMDVVIDLSWRITTSEHVHRLYGIRVEFYANPIYPMHIF